MKAVGVAALLLLFAASSNADICVPQYRPDFIRQWTASGVNEHYSGAHEIELLHAPKCNYKVDCSVDCSVEEASHAREDGSVVWGGIGWVHEIKGDTQWGEGGGTPFTQTECTGSSVVGVDSCLQGWCNLTISITNLPIPILGGEIGLSTGGGIGWWNSGGPNRIGHGYHHTCGTSEIVRVGEPGPGPTPGPGPGPGGGGGGPSPTPTPHCERVPVEDCVWHEETYCYMACGYEEVCGSVCRAQLAPGGDDVRAGCCVDFRCHDRCNVRAWCEPRIIYVDHCT